MALPRNREEFKRHIIRKLGGDFTKIEISPAQMDDVVDESIVWFRENVYDFSKDVVFLINTSSKVYDYKLPDNIWAVMDILDNNIWTQITYGFPTYTKSREEVDFIMRLGKTGGNAETPITDLSIQYQNVEAFKKQFIPKMEWRYNYNTGMLNLLSDPGSGRLILFANQFIDFDNSRIWENNEFTKYVEAKTKVQWGQNLRKFGQLNLAGGGEINYEAILQEGREDQKELEEWLLNNRGDVGWMGIYWG